MPSVYSYLVYNKNDISSHLVNCLTLLVSVSPFLKLVILNN